MGFFAQPLRERRDHSRFADPRLAREQHHLTLPLLCAFPPTQQKFEFLVSPIKWCRRRRAQRLEPACSAGPIPPPQSRAPRPRRDHGIRKDRRMSRRGIRLNQNRVRPPPCPADGRAEGPGVSPTTSCSGSPTADDNHTGSDPYACAQTRRPVSGPRQSIDCGQGAPGRPLCVVLMRAEDSRNRSGSRRPYISRRSRRNVSRPQRRHDDKRRSVLANPRDRDAPTMRSNRRDRRTSPSVGGVRRSDSPRLFQVLD